MKIKNVIIGLVLFSGIVLAIVMSSISFGVRAQGGKPTVGHIILYEAGSTSGGSPSMFASGMNYIGGASYVWRGTQSFVENIFLPGTDCVLRVKCCYTILEMGCQYTSTCNPIKSGTPGSCFDGGWTDLDDYEYQIDCTTTVENAELNHVSVSYKC